MQMVAASKMRKAQQAAVVMRPFVQLVYRIQREATTRIGSFTHPLLQVRDVRKRAIILVAADKGLCGALNSNLFRQAAQYDPESTVFVAAGRKAAQFLARSRRRMVAEFAYPDAPRYADAKAIAAFARDLFLKGEADQVLVIATRFVNTLTLQPICIEYLPVGEIKGLKIPGVEFEKHLMADTSEVLFEPSPKAVLAYLIPHYLNIFMYQVLLNAKASEHSARMVSMQNATESADDLIKDLTLEYNKRRQTNITQELLEIAGGQAG